MPEPLGHRALVVSPFPLAEARGNATTAQRTAHRLAARGATTRVVTPEDLPAALASFEPDVLHGIHAGHFAHALDRAGVVAGDGPALVLTIGGNDLYEALDVATDERHPGGHDDAASRLVERAGAVVTSTHAQHTALLERHPRPDEVFLAPKYPEVGHAPLPDFDARLAGRGPVLAWCGAMRHQKRPAWILPIHRALAARLPDLVTLVAGPPSQPGCPDEDRYARLEAELAAEPGILRVPTFPSGPTAEGGAVGSLLAACDLVLNTSRTEGVANFLLEAMHERVPVLAARTPGNRDWLTDQAELFEDPGGAVEAAFELLSHEPRRQALGARGRTWLDEHADPEREADVLAAAHRRALASRGR